MAVGRKYSILKALCDAQLLTSVRLSVLRAEFMLTTEVDSTLPKMNIAPKIC